MLRRNYFILAFAILTGMLLAVPVGARAADFSSQEVKVGFIYNFAKFVHWPKSSWNRQELTLGIIGEDPFGPALKSLKGKQIQGVQLRVRRISTYAEARSCQILYIAQSHSSQLPGLLAALAEAPVLTVSDIPGFIGQGGMIGLLDYDQKIRFALNFKSVRAAGLTLDAQLLKLAFAVIRDEKE
jgi:YfiR/HmsC-like